MADVILDLEAREEEFVRDPLTTSLAPPSLPAPLPIPLHPPPTPQAIKVSDGGGADREVVREAVRRQRRNIGRSLSQEAGSNQPSMPTMAEIEEYQSSEGTAAAISERDHYDSSAPPSAAVSPSERARLAQERQQRRQQQQQQQRYGSSSSELVPAAAGVPFGTAQSRMTSASDARLTSMSSWTTDREESVAASSPATG